jgi:SAM-dependent methyltransferase
MSTSDRERWNEKYSHRQPPSYIEADAWLIEAIELIEQSASVVQTGRRALDIACGLGHNAIWLAQRGWQVDGIDISNAGLQLARQSAETGKSEVNWIEADLDIWEPSEDLCDLAIVFRFLDRVHVPRVASTALRAGGWLIYETFSRAQLKRADTHIRNPVFTLAAGELPTLFPDFDVVIHREDVLGDRTVERFLARRR